MTAFLATLRAALSLFVLRRPRLPARPLGAGAFWPALLLVAAFGALDDFLATQAPRALGDDGLRGLAFHALLAIANGALLARFARRPRLAWLLAGLTLLLAAFAEYALRPVESGLLAPLASIGAERASSITDALWGIWLALALMRTLHWVAPHRGRAARTLAAVVFAAATIVPRYYVSIGNFFAEAPEPEETVEAPAEPAFDPERLMAAQPGLLAEKLANLAPQRPGEVDLYAVVFGGDAGEDVFRNEVEYAQKLFEQRFGAGGRTLALLNHAQTTNDVPLATRANLVDALAEIGRVADHDEDIVLVFLTSHGSRSHQLKVTLDPLPLQPLGPGDVRAALDGSGIRHRVVVVSACYAGGFIPALRDDHTMVIAAARADRASFGCGAESEITYFGHAFLVDALNQTEDFNAAFGLARQEIDGWETEQQQAHSLPEMATTPQIERQLARWRAGLHAGFPLPFRPAGDKGPALLP
jgi:hypothetical protein